MNASIMPITESLAIHKWRDAFECQVNAGRPVVKMPRPSSPVRSLRPQPRVENGLEPALYTRLLIVWDFCQSFRSASLS